MDMHMAIHDQLTQQWCFIKEQYYFCCTKVSVCCHALVHISKKVACQEYVLYQNHYVLYSRIFV